MLDILDGQGAGHNWPKSKLAEVEFAELEKFGRKRNWPKSSATFVSGRFLPGSPDVHGVIGSFEYVFPTNNSAYKYGTTSIVLNSAAEAAVKQKAKGLSRALW